ncbi:hypothetical protein AB0B45_14450 [Nonomuraea sp. NPDC049152]|uniref:hypothetical protein n=1 Tax=Nonomuraea sp. NPDC049152 TaxID=3154350 RepID=UPI0033DB5A11
MIDDQMAVVIAPWWAILLIRIRPVGDVADCDHLIFVAHQASAPAENLIHF